MQAARRPVISPFQVLQLQRKIINFFIKHLEASNLLRRIIEERQKEVKTHVTQRLQAFSGHTNRTQ